MNKSSTIRLHSPAFSSVFFFEDGEAGTRPKEKREPSDLASHRFKKKKKQ